MHTYQMRMWNRDDTSSNNRRWRCLGVIESAKVLQWSGSSSETSMSLKYPRQGLTVRQPWARLLHLCTSAVGSPTASRQQQWGSAGTSEARQVTQWVYEMQTSVKTPSTVNKLGRHQIWVARRRQISASEVKGPHHERSRHPIQRNRHGRSHNHLRDPRQASARRPPDGCITQSLRRLDGMHIAAVAPDDVLRVSGLSVAMSGKGPPETARKDIAAPISPTTSYIVPGDVRTALATRVASQTARSGLTEES